MQKQSGRPRQQELNERILNAAITLGRELGYEQVTVQMVADAAQVGRQSIYRRWPSKEEMMADALLLHASDVVNVRFSRLSESAEVNICGMFCEMAKLLGDDGVLTKEFLIAAQNQPALQQIYVEKIATPWIANISKFMDGINPSLDPSLLHTMATMIQSTFMYQLLIGQELDRAFCEKLAAVVCPQILRGF
ncbi:hypothetical protein BK648_07690 [Pseudomonas poae]|uniref:HTH tetR-type domain-containing protein n=1 Tax=Pseudomonas poae TaxID=200451 RepID=A0A423FAU0_9PSED|nr:TetR/AcrR family transcriptional regulator [Pseudomonas poae]ROM53418.1 hypothetical protein BK648_07690 [Pseudomonas poae]